MPRAKATPKKYAPRSSYVRRGYRKPRAGSTYRRNYYPRYKAIANTPPQFMLAQLNPFDPAARGVRVPDESTAPSSAFHLFDNDSITPSSGGVAVNNEICAGLYLPNCNTYKYSQSATSVGITTVTWDATFTPITQPSKLSSVVAQYSVARPVAHGIRLTCPLAPTTVTGFAHIALLSIDTYNSNGLNGLFTNGILPNSVAGMRELPHYRRVTLASLTQEPLVVVNKYLDTTAFRYVDTNSNELAAFSAEGVFHVPQSWMAILVMVEGHSQSPGTSVLNVDNMCHFEGQSKASGLNTDDSAETANPDVFDGTSSAAGQSPASYLSSEQGTVGGLFTNKFNDWITQFGRATTRQVVNTASRAAAAGIVGGAAMFTNYMQQQRGMPGINNLGRIA